MDTTYDGSLPLVGVNTFLPKDHGGDIVAEIELIRSTPEEKGQIRNVEAFRAISLSALQAPARDRKNVFAALVEAVKRHSLEQISHALYGGWGVLPQYVAKAIRSALSPMSAGICLRN